MFKPSTVAKIIELIGVNIRKIMFYFYFIEIPENQLIFNKNVLCTLKTIRRKMKMKNLAKKNYLSVCSEKYLECSHTSKLSCSDILKQSYLVLVGRPFSINSSLS